MALTQLIDKQKTPTQKTNGLTSEEQKEIDLASEILLGLDDNGEGIILTSKDMIDVYCPTDYYKNKALKKACKEFFERLCDEIVKGFQFSSPIGKIRVIKKMVTANKNFISWPATKKLQKETGDKTKVVYRENEYYFRFHWDRIPLKHFYVYNFNVNVKQNRRCEENREILRTLITTEYQD